MNGYTKCCTGVPNVLNLLWTYGTPGCITAGIMSLSNSFILFLLKNLLQKSQFLQFSCTILNNYLAKILTAFDADYLYRPTQLYYCIFLNFIRSGKATKL